MPDVARRALLVGLDALEVQSVSPDPSSHADALRWAGRLGQPVAYDAKYLALAERLDAEFWTADRRLCA